MRISSQLFDYLFIKEKAALFSECSFFTLLPLKDYLFSSFGGRGKRALRESLNLPVF